MSKLYLSIAMCTYNGEKYLQEQLDSIANQKRLPDELVICDDRSNDATHDIITKFSSQAPFTVRFYINDANIGSTKNFEKAINLCEGNIIVLSDQDDVWQTEKLIYIELAFIDAPNVGAVFSDAEIVDEQLNQIKRSLWDSFLFNNSERKKIRNGEAINVLVKHSVVTGATMAFRKKYCDILLPIPSGQVHDNWISLVLSAVSSFALIEIPLIKYRQHATQQIGSAKGNLPLKEEVRLARMTSSNSYLREIELLTNVLNRMKLFRHEYPVPDKILSLINNKIHHRQARVDLPICKPLRLPIIIKEVITLRYWLFSRGFKSIAKDLSF